MAKQYPVRHVPRVISDLSCYIITIYITWSLEQEAVG